MRTLAERVLSMVRRGAPLSSGQPLQVAVSIGACCVTHDMVPGDRLVFQADVALRAAKSQGGDQLQVYRTLVHAG